MSTAPHLDTYLDLKGLEAIRERVAGKLGAKAAAEMAVRELTLTVAPEHVVEVLTFLRDDKSTRFTQLMDLCGVDYLGQKPDAQRFAVVYHLLSLEKNQRIRVKTYVAEGKTVPTVTGVFPAAGWYEREAYDMYGVVFEGNLDLRRLLTDYDFEGFPLRKDFPLEGHVEAYYDAAQGRVAYKPVDLPQEFRHFDKVSEWQGATGNAALAEEDKPFNPEEFR